MQPTDTSDYVPLFKQGFMFVRLLIAVHLSIHCIAAGTAAAQPSTYYDQQAQNREYDRLHQATTRAFSVPSSSSSSSSYSSSSSSSSSSSATTRASAGGTIGPATANNWALTDYHDWQVRMGEKVARDNAARRSAYEGGTAKYRALIAARGTARTAADHFDLLLTGMRAGMDTNYIFGVIGYDITAYRQMNGTEGPPFVTNDADKAKARKDATVEALIKSALEAKPPASRASIYSLAIELSPSAALYRNMADAYREAHEYLQAIRAYQKAESMEKGSFRSLLGLAAAQGLAGNAAEGERLYLEALGLAPSVDIDMNIAWMRIQQGNAVGALECARKAAAKNPSDPGPILAQAALSADTGTAKALLEKAARQTPALEGMSLPQALFTYAKFLQTDGAYELSILYLDLTMRADPANMSALELRYGTNTLLKREKASQEDEALLTK